MELYRDVGVSFCAVKPTMADVLGNGIPEENGDDSEPKFDMVRVIKRMRRYRRENQSLRRLVDNQRALIVKYRQIMGSYMEDTSFAV